MTEQIILIILTSSFSAAIISAITSGFINWLIQRDNYKRDYHKLLIKKRVEAYEGVEPLLIELRTINRLGERDCHNFLLHGDERFKIFFAKLVNAGNFTFWHSPRLRQKLIDFNLFIINQITETIRVTGIDSYADLGFQHFKTIRKFRSEIEDIINDDLKELYDVEKYIKNNRELLTIPE